MSSTYIIDNTAGSSSFSIFPGTLDGPGGLNRNTDLYLYGEGSLQWGEGVIEDIYRLAENFACPQKEVGDAGYVAGVPRPKDETDLAGIGLGITTPIDGQLWYNTTTKTTYIYDLSADDWRTTNGMYIDTDPFAPVLGDLKWDSTFHTSGLLGQLLIFNGTSFVSVAHEYVELNGDTMTGTLTMGTGADIDMGTNSIINMADPVNPQDAMTFSFADARYVNVTGDSMSGALNMSAVITMGANKITGLADPSNPQDAMTLNHADNTYVNVIGDTMTGNLTIFKSDPRLILRSPSSAAPSYIVFNNSSDVIRSSITSDVTNGNLYLEARNVSGVATGQAIVDTGGNVSVNGAVPLNVNHLTRKDYVDLKAPINSPTLTGDPRSVTFGASDNSTRIATTAYVKSQTTDVGAVIFATSTSSTTVPSGITRAEITISAGGGGGAGGGDGGNFTGPNGSNGNPSYLAVPGYGTITMNGGWGGRGTQGAIIYPRGPAPGWGESIQGGHGLQGNPGRGGHGGASEYGYGGEGVGGFPATGQAGQYGGGGSGGWGQDNAAGEGGASGKCHSRIYNVSAGGTISWTIGTGGAGGTGSSRSGGAGGKGFIVIRWLKA